MKFLKVLLIVILTVVTLVALAVGGFGYFIYKNVNKHMVELSCRDYMGTLDTMAAALANPETELTLDQQMALRMTGLLQNVYVMGRVHMDHPDAGDKALDLMSEEAYVTYLNELAAICTAYPQVLAKDLANMEEVQNAEAKGKILNEERVRQLTNGLKVTEHKVSTMLAKVYATEMRARQVSARILQNAQGLSATVVSGTDVSSTVEGVQ